MIAYLEKHGPTKAAVVAKALGIPSGSTTVLFRKAEFQKLPDKRIWITDRNIPGETELTKPDKSVKPVKQQRDTATLQRQIEMLLKQDQPLEARDIARRLDAPSSQITSILASVEKFELSDGVYWLQ